MSTTHTTSGIQVTEYEEPDTEDITLESGATEYERLADVFADGRDCPSCMHYEHGQNRFTGRRWRECAAFSPRDCPALNPRAIANQFRRQAS
jgi:hypothetical protein